MKKNKLEKAILAMGGNFTQDTLNNLSADTLKNLSADTLNNLSADTLKNLSADTLKNLSANTLNNLSADTLNNLSADTLNNLSAYTLKNLSADTLNNLSADTLNNLSADTLKNLSADTLKNLSADTLNNLSAYTLKNLSADTLNNLSADTLNNLSAYTLKNLSADTLKKIESMWDSVPKLENPYSTLLDDIKAKRRIHNQSTFGPDYDPKENLCGTQMCTAGHLVNEGGSAGYKLQKQYGWQKAASLLHIKAHPDMPTQNFGAIDQSDAMAYIEMAAAFEQRENKKLTFDKWLKIQLKTTEP